MNADRPAMIAAALKKAMPDCRVDIVDDSHRHAGHAGARDGRGHFRARIVSSAFENATRIERHRMVFAAVSTLMETDIHALNIQALTPAEEDAAGSGQE